MKMSQKIGVLGQLAVAVWASTYVAAYTTLVPNPTDDYFWSIVFAPLYQKQTNTTHSYQTYRRICFLLSQWNQSYILIPETEKCDNISSDTVMTKLSIAVISTEHSDKKN